jgi:hypothetical protein
MIDRNDAETLSAYLDGNLNPGERAHLESRLEGEPVLRAELTSLGRTRDLLRSAPHYRAPRNFTLTPEMAGIRAEKPGFLFGLTRLAFTLTTIMFVIALAGNFTFQGLGGPQPEEPAAISSDTDVTMESLEQAAAPALEDAAEDAAGAAEAQSMEAMEAESVEGGEPPEEFEAVAPPTEESFSVGEAATDSQPLEDPVAEGTVTAEAIEKVPGTEEVVQPEIAAAPADGERSAVEFDAVSEPETARVNPWSIFAVLTGAAALLSGALTLALRRK